MIGVVIAYAPGREQNLAQVLTCLVRQSKRPARVIALCDGGAEQPQIVGFPEGMLVWAATPKHEPGMEQPRNIGVRLLREHCPQATHVWFLDSDIVVGAACLQQLELALRAGAKDRIVVAPYDWLPAGWRPDPSVDGGQLDGFRNDPRWAMFEASPPARVYQSDLSAGLACFSGNLLWPLDQFERVGGFWSEIHHGRCEDGELGLRAVAMDVGISFAATARGWHLWHEINTELAIARNARDVPMLNERHPWVERGAVFMVDRDGKAFDVRCRCGEVVPTIGWWAHAADCGEALDLALPV